MSLSDETTDVGFYSLEEMAGIDVMANSMERIVDAIAGLDPAFVR